MESAGLEPEDAGVGFGRPVGPRMDLIREGETPHYVNLILEGFACRYKILPTGRRQIMAYLVPGDFCDLHVFILKAMDHTIATLSPCTIAIGKAVEKYVKAKRKAVAKCEDKRSDGRLAPATNCRPADGAVTDQPTADKLSAAGDKVLSKISGACPGPLPPLGASTAKILPAACSTAS